MAGAFLLPALSPEDGIPVAQAGRAALLRCIVMSSPLMFSCSRSSQLCQFYFSLPRILTHGVVAFSLCLPPLFLSTVLSPTLCVVLLYVLFLCVRLLSYSAASVPGFIFYDQTVAVDMR